MTARLCHLGGHSHGCRCVFSAVVAYRLTLTPDEHGVARTSDVSFGAVGTTSSHNISGSREIDCRVFGDTMPGAVRRCGDVVELF